MIKFTVKHHYKNIPIEISVEAANTEGLDQQLSHAIEWIKESRFAINQMCEALKANTQQEQKP